MTLSEEVGRVINTVDMLGVALATEMHIWTDEERSAYDYVSHNLPRRVQELEAERSGWRNIAEAALFQYDVLMKHAKELEEENRQWQACHEAELGVCQTECDVVAALEAENERLRNMVEAAREVNTALEDVPWSVFSVALCRHLDAMDDALAALDEAEGGQTR